MFGASPGGSVVKNPPANEGDEGLIPGSGKIPRATEQLIPQLLGPCSRAREPQLLSPHAASVEAGAP